MNEPRTPTEQLQRQVRVWRERRKLSAREVADRIEAIGGKLTRVAISRIENGQRDVSLDEWLQLAHALVVPPPLLLLDLEESTKVRIGENFESFPWPAWGWVTGQSPLFPPDGPSHSEEWHQAQKAIVLYQQQMEASTKIGRAQAKLNAAEFAGKEPPSATREALFEGLEELSMALDGMIEAGIKPPPKPQEWINQIHELGLSKYAGDLPSTDTSGASRPTPSA